MNPLKKITVASIGLFLSGCATPEQTFSDRTIPALELNVQSGTYMIGGVERSVTNCETSDFHCLNFEGFGAVAMFKNCSAYSNEFTVPGIPGVYRMYAPSPHLSPPAGSFYNSENRAVIFHFNKRDGLYQIDINDSEPNLSKKPVRKLRIQATDGRQVFHCRNFMDTKIPGTQY